MPKTEVIENPVEPEKVEAAPLAIIDDGWCEFRETELFIVRVPTFEEYAEQAPALAGMMQSSPWWVGDYINFGEGTFGEKYSQVLDLFGKRSYQTAANYSSVCRRVSRSVRRADLTFSHHDVVASLPDDEQIALLSEAAEHGWTVKQLRRARKGEDPNKVPKKDSDDRTDEEKLVDALKASRREAVKARELEHDLRNGKVIDEVIGRLEDALWFYGIEVD